MISIEHAVPRDDVALGVVRAENVEMSRTPHRFDARLDDLLQRRKTELSSKEEGRRTAARDILRNGTYKPTGRGKPASEYLLRAAAQPEDRFPRINGPVDICNYMSLRHVLPISLWDVDRAAAARFRFRLGREGERYVFNDGGQQIDLKDLLVGCRVREGANPTDEPIVNPVRDSLATKTNADTHRVAACLYAPLNVVSPADLKKICAEFLALLAECGDNVDGGYAVLTFGSTVDL